MAKYSTYSAALKLKLQQLLQDFPAIASPLQGGSLNTGQIKNQAAMSELIVAKTELSLSHIKSSLCSL